jgi:hypothetical protein
MTPAKLGVAANPLSTAAQAKEIAVFFENTLILSLQLFCGDRGLSSPPATSVN